MLIETSQGNMEYVTALDDTLSEAFSAPVWREKVRGLTLIPNAPNSFPLLE